METILNLIIDSLKEKNQEAKSKEFNKFYNKAKKSNKGQTIEFMGKKVFFAQVN